MTITIDLTPTERQTLEAKAAPCGLELPEYLKVSGLENTSARRPPYGQVQYGSVGTVQKPAKKPATVRPNLPRFPLGRVAVIV